MLGYRLFKFRIPFAFSTENDDGEGVWSKIATTVMERPWAVLIPTLIILLGAGLPFLQADFSIASRDALPPDDETRVGFEHMDEKWPEGAVNAATIVVVACACWLVLSPGYSSRLYIAAHVILPV